jgi:phage FluMu protein Com
VPLPKSHVNIHFLDKDSNIIEDIVFKRRETGYQASAEYYPTMKAIKCAECGKVGVLEFLGGLNLKEADRVMEGKTIRGTCLKCKKLVDLVPLPVDDPRNEKVRLYYHMQQSLNGAVRRGQTLGPTGEIIPEERMQSYERWKNGEQQ